MSTDRLDFHGKPIPKPRMTRADAWKKRPVVESYWAFKDEIKLQAKAVNFVLSEAHRVTFFVEMPKSWSKKKRMEMYGHTQKLLTHGI